MFIRNDTPRKATGGRPQRTSKLTAKAKAAMEHDEDEDEAPMSVSEALKNPLWHVSLEPEVKACAACPGKLLKNPVMIEVHMKSGVSCCFISRHARC